MNEKRDKLIIEALGGCWHDYFILDGGTERITLRGECKKCKSLDDNPDLSTPDGFFWVLDKLWGMKWSGEFLIYIQENANLWKYDPQAFPIFFLNPDRLMDILAWFLESRK